jgi:CelD/BcsL family acetyltransferase involved in cellulose biosynthesis
VSAIDHPRAASIHCEVVPLSAIPAAWDKAWASLAQRAAEPNAFAENWFLRASATHLAPPDDGRLLTVWQGPELIGLVPLCVAPKYGRVPVRHVQNWLHFHAFLGTPLVRAGRERDFWIAALDALDKAEWAPGFLHMNGLAEDGPVHRALAATRRTDTVYRSERALLETGLSPDAYYEAHVRKKKRKEIARLQSRLREHGTVTCDRLQANEDTALWCRDFLALEASGWKGRGGSALGSAPATSAFFTDAISAAHAQSRLEILRLSVDGKPIAMLVNFLVAPGSFSFKIAFDEDYARFSPGVLIQLENLKILDRDDIAWMDSCAIADHSMINSLWAERRRIVRVTIPLKGAVRQAAFMASRSLETGAALVRKMVR